jgi:hypothetical protein
VIQSCSAHPLVRSQGRSSTYLQTLSVWRRPPPILKSVPQPSDRRPVHGLQSLGRSNKRLRQEWPLGKSWAARGRKRRNARVAQLEAVIGAHQVLPRSLLGRHEIRSALHAALASSVREQGLPARRRHRGRVSGLTRISHTNQVPVPTAS